MGTTTETSMKNTDLHDADGLDQQSWRRIDVHSILRAFPFIVVFVKVCDKYIVL